MACRCALSDLRGQTVLLNFWGTWCGPCRREMPELVQLYNDQTANQPNSFELLALAVRDNEHDVREFIIEFDLPFLVALDDDETIVRQYAITGQPSTLLIDASGTIRFKSFSIVTQEQLATALADIEARPVSMTHITDTSVEARRLQFAAGVTSILLGLMLLAVGGLPVNQPALVTLASADRLQAQSLLQAGEPVNPAARELSSSQPTIRIVSFWATWCAPCRVEMPRLQAIADAYADRQVTVIGINSGEAVAQVAGWLRDYDITFPNWIDRSLALQTDFRVTGLPITYLVDAQEQSPVCILFPGRV